MKRILLSLFCLSFSLSSIAQKSIPEIKEGTAMNASVLVQGTQLPLSFTIKSLKSPITIAWNVEGYGGGDFVMTEKALESGSAIYLSQASLGTTKLGDTETYGFISKAAYKSLLDTKGFTYSGIKFKAKAINLTPINIGGKEIDATQIVSEDGKIELWILNNPSFPFILRTSGMPIDILVNEIK